ncbi:hypothetical protein B0H17DRAFT_1095722 [Mycena rosella]|uniref:Uncharacterized protein n=1 Tax=Mycena rosella TaxID=1033263 RepID=A0AAD7CRI1_MYCRO|nr:hypothetical protein B0H17DRAFT_1095722 [Mycena rosella]
MPKNAAVKTLYTAKFFETPSSSESTHPSSSKPQPSAYLEGLFQTHVALNQMEEVPDSRPNTPERIDPERVEALRKQVVDAFNAAKNPASGKWGILANLLQTGSAKGKYRYLGTTTDAVPPEPGPDGWLLADTEEEWLAWEEKRKEERKRAEVKRKQGELLEENRRAEEKLSKKRLNEKVETWARSVDPIPRPDLQGDPVKAHTRTGSSSRPTKSTSLASGGPKPPSKSATNSRSLKSHPRSIAELPEAAFLPPSFPSHLDTSTPPAPNRYKPSPIEKELVPDSSPLSSPTKRRAGPSRNDDTKLPSSPPKFSPADDVPSSSPLSSPKNSRVYGRPRLPESPLKRARSSSPTPLSVSKKPRAALPSSPGPASGSAPPTSPSPAKAKPSSIAPFTPPRNPLPKMADLIAASSAQKQKSKGKGKEREKQKERSKEKQQHAYSPKPKSESPSQSPRLMEDPEELNRDISVSPSEQRRLDLEAGVGVAEHDVNNWDEALENTIAGFVVDAVASPSKSLSSIDGSNSLESQGSMELPDFSHGDEFDPQCASTQPMGQLESGVSLTTTERGGRGFGQPQEDYSYPMRYESQMDVESNMQGVEQLLAEDVGRYSGPWMGQGPDDDDEEQWGQGSGQIDSSP